MNQVLHNRYHYDRYQVSIIMYALPQQVWGETNQRWGFVTAFAFESSHLFVDFWTSDLNQIALSLLAYFSYQSQCCGGANPPEQLNCLNQYGDTKPLDHLKENIYFTSEWVQLISLVNIYKKTLQLLLQKEAISETLI